MKHFVCIHAHFYQPPRENPWLEEVELQDTAYPYHDWNERVTAECYAPNTASRIVDTENRIVDLVNTYSKISFNVGPTLCAWMERHRPDVLEAIIDADRKSREYFSGHGSAIAQVYNHMIMPLANERDKQTQVAWGITDFQKRFGRPPEGMWLPETAVDIATLETLARFHIEYTILVPHQAGRIREMKKGMPWDAVGPRIDPTMPYLCRLPSGKSITLFFYDGPISHDVAFGNLLENGEGFATRLSSVFFDQRTWPQLVHIATDGESYGHHRKFGDMALAYALHRLESIADLKLTNYGEYLEKHKPTHQVEIVENTSWSCIHGVERWRNDCGCSAGRPGWKQAWRKPLREALDALRDELSVLYESEAGKILRDPWQARDDYYSVIADRSGASIERFFGKHAHRRLDREESARALTLLEMQRNCMLMYTSCGWFFDDISGIETTQVLRYAAKAIQDAEMISGKLLEPEFIDALSNAPANVMRNGREVYLLIVKPSNVDLMRIGVQYAILSLFIERHETENVYCYTAEKKNFKKIIGRSATAAVGRIRIVSSIQRIEQEFEFVALHYNEYTITCGIRKFDTAERYTELISACEAAVAADEINSFPGAMKRWFGENLFSLQHLFRDEQCRVLNEILSGTLETAKTTLDRMFENNLSAMSLLQNLRQTIPDSFVIPAQLVLGSRFASMLDRRTLDLRTVETLAHYAGALKLDLRLLDGIELEAGKWIRLRLEELALHPLDAGFLNELTGGLQALLSLRLQPDLWKAQNMYFTIGRSVYPDQKLKAATGDSSAKQWVALFRELGKHLNVDLP